jgi:hypothetical protein
MPRPKKNTVEDKENIIQPLEFEMLALQIIGVRPLIVHAWDAKTQREMIAKQMGLTNKGPKNRTRDPKAEFEATLYRIPEELGGGYGVPAAAFKQCFVDACRHTDLKMTETVGAFHVRGVEVDLPPISLQEFGSDLNLGTKSMEMIPIFGDEPEMRTDMVRLESGVADIRFRAWFRNWYCIVPVQIAKGSMTVKQVADLANRAGFHCGICEWRPFSKKSKNGSYGMFRVAVTDEEKALFEGKSAPSFII